MTDHFLRIVGMPGSPYSRKMRAVLRYRRVPHVWVHQGCPEARGLPQPRVALLPQLILHGPDGAPEAVPFLIANAEALQRGAARVECTVDGRRWVQQPFPYQGKCLRWLREGYAALAPDDRRAVDALLHGTGCERLFGGTVP